MNIELLKKVRAAIADETKAFDMDSWGVGVTMDGEWWEVCHYPGGPGRGHCGTPACLAGWAIRLSGPRLPDGVQGPEPIDVEDRAAGLLGLGEIRWPDRGNGEYSARSYDLFRVNAWPFWTTEVDDNRIAAVAMLDLIIVGDNPWDPPSNWTAP